MPPSSPTERSAIAATPHPEAAIAAAEALRRGGNAVDAACAATFTLCVVLPNMVGIGGYGGSMVAHLADGRGIVAIDFDSRAPLAYRDDLYMPDPKVSRLGYLAVSVPGVVAGLELAIRKFGKLTFRDATTHALHLATTGIEIDANYRKLLEDWHKRADAASMTAFFPDGIPAVGKRWTQPDLAQLIARLGEEGPSAMYRGDVPRQIARQIHDHGGILSEEDFAAYKPTLVDPLTISYRGHNLYTPPPPSGGLTTLQVLQALARFDLKAMEPFGAKYLHTLAEITRACWRDRDLHIGDPDVIEIPTIEMLSDAHADAIAAGVTDRAAPVGNTSPPEAEHTINVITGDADGSVCSLTATQGEQFGSGVVIEGLGLLLGHGMSRFTYVPGSPNAPAPGKRMHHNMSPLLILRDGKPRFVVGMPGGQKIPNITAQIVVNLIDFAQSPTDSIQSPRLHTTGAEPVSLTGNIPADVIADLQARGHTIQRVGSLGGPANAMAIDPASGFSTAASEAGMSCVALR